MEHLDRFAVLRQVLPQDRYGDDEVAAILDRCCELLFRGGSVLADVGQRVEGWLVVIEGELEITEPARRWTAGPGAIVQPSRGATAGVATLRVVATRSTTVLQLVAGDEDRRP